MSEPTPPRRVRVVSPRTVARAAAHRPVRREIDEQTIVGEVYMRSLVRLQLQLAIGICLIFAVLLGVVVYPVLVLTAWFYVRQAERNERDFAELVQ